MHAFKSVHQVVLGYNNGICWSDSWFHGILVFDKESIASSLDENDDFAIVFRGGTVVLAIHRMFSPCGTRIRFDMELHLQTALHIQKEQVVFCCHQKDVLGAALDWWRRFRVKMVCGMSASHDGKAVINTREC